MAHPHALPASDPEASPQDPFATSLTVNLLDHEEENPDEWEYEYSATETETFYVTLDLTTEDTASKNRSRRNAGSGGAKAKWLNPALGRVKRKMAQDRSEDKASKLRRNQIPSTIPRSAADSDDDAPASPDSISGSQDDASRGKASKIQILGLHSKNPVVSYNGNVFSCQWADNIGTELLFTARDPDSTLPVLRKLPGDADLLGMSSIRIISNSLILEPKTTARQPESTNRKEKTKKTHGFRIPVGAKASDERKGQAQFLEKLVNIKAARGEEDEVTVYATRRLSRKGWQTHMEKKRSQERHNCEKILKSKKGTDQKKILGARKRLEELDQEDEMMKLAEKTWLEESRPQGMGRIRVVSRDDGPEPARKRVRVDGPDNAEAETPRSSIPTPTPMAWEDGNEGFFDEDGIEEDDEEDMEETFLEDDDDEDAPGEDDDAPSEEIDTQLAYGWS